MKKKIFILVTILLTIFSFQVRAEEEPVINGIAEDDFEHPETIFTEPREVYVFNPNGAVLYEKASTSSKTIATIPTGSVVEELGTTITEKEYWAFVVYDNQAGYINACPNPSACGDSMVAEKSYSEEKVSVSQEVKLYSFPKNDENYVIGNVSLNKEITILYHYGFYPAWYYIECDGQKGWVYNNTSFTYDKEEKIVLLDDSFLYRDFNSEASNIKYNSGEVVTILAKQYVKRDNDDCFFGKIKYNDQEMWLLISSSKIRYAELTTENEYDAIIFGFTDGIKIYDTVNKNNVVATYKTTDVINEMYSYTTDNGDKIIYVISKDYNGFIFDKFRNYVNDDIKKPDETKGFSLLSVGIFILILGIVALGTVVFMVSKQAKKKI